MSKKKQSKEEYDAFFALLTGVFTEQWNKAYKKIKSRKKASLIEHMPIIFRRWYFSALIEDSILTPANLALALNKEFGVPELITPHLFVDGNEGKAIPYYVLTDYSTEKHPVINDLRIFLESLGSTFDTAVLKGDKLPEGLSALSIRDSEYLEFLYDISVVLKLIKKMPSINTTIGMVNNSYRKFFDNPPETMLDKIINATIERCVTAVSEILPIKKTFKRKLASCLKTETTVDTLFSDMFSDSGLDIMRLFDEFDHNIDILNDMLGVYDGSRSGTEDDDCPETENSAMNMEISSIQADLMTGTYFLGIALDKFFLTPMSYYLRVIQALYTIPFNLDEELENFLDCLPKTDEAGSFVYAPCSVFAPTSLGKRLTGDEGGNNKGGVFLPDSIPVASILMSLADIIEAASDNRKSDETALIMTVKILLEDNKRYWLNAEITEDMSLEGLHVFICQAFGLDMRLDYSFFAGEQESPFSEYTPASPKNKKKQRKTNITRFSDLSLSPEDTLLYRIYDCEDYLKPSIIKKKVGFTVKILKCEEKLRDNQCPRVIRRGKAMDEQE